MFTNRLCGATVARLTPDQKAACSNHVRVKLFVSKCFAMHDLVMDLACYILALTPLT